ncbi:c-type cytochrome [Roseococcus sp. YIM B11640]|uniref:c-type cytochrome n=1 Tax=Roseococcus sp. YIM B11640 TaxID=3133973 RepID=UPI003C7DB2FD
MRPRWPLLGLVATVALAAGAWFVSAPRPAFGEADAGRFEGGDAARGRVVFLAGECASCHATPGQDDRLRLGGGMALSAPLGTFRPPNISPDPANGIGRWRGVDLANALMSGVSPDGRHYFPALPYVAYARMTVEDVADLMAYLRTLEPVQGRPPPHELPFPLNIRRSIGFWKLFFLDRRPLTPEPARGAAWNRGQYLVEALAHCVECHSSRNLLGAIRPATRYAGGPDMEGTGFVPNITPERIGDWQPSDMVTLLTTGRRPDGRRVGSSMADVVANTSGLSPSDREAIAAYILSLPRRPTPAP